MSYGNVYIERDIRKLKHQGHKKKGILIIIARKINERYPNISYKKAWRIATKMYEGRSTTAEDWTPDLDNMGNRFKFGL